MEIKLIHLLTIWNEPYGARQQAIAKTHAKRSAYQILGVIFLFVV
jgi:hypothetical protein